MYQHSYGHGGCANNLWIARKRAGLPQKWVASLLGHHSLSQVSEYECGRKLPGLRTALKLELIYGTPLEKLYPDLRGELLREITSAGDHNAMIKQRMTELREHVARGGTADGLARGTAGGTADAVDGGDA